MQNQDLKNRSKKRSKLFLIIIPIVTLIAIGIFFLRNIKDHTNKLNQTNLTILEKNIIPHLQPENSNLPTDQSSTTSSPECLKLNNLYSKLEAIKKMPSATLRYQNIHKRMDGSIYRLRFFYKDGAENERKHFLVYKENQSLDGEEAEIVEKSPYKKGPLYLKVERNNEEIVYNEEAFTIGSNQETFVVYINQKINLIQIQNLECKF